MVAASRRTTVPMCRRKIPARRSSMMPERERESVRGEKERENVREREREREGG